MRYVGGKSRIASAIAQTIFERSTQHSLIYEPFMGGGAMTAQLAKRFAEVRASDFQEDLVLMWQEVLKGWTPPSVVSEDEYKALRNAEPSALRGFVGFGGSFGGKFFGGYARGGKNADGTPRNHQAESSRAVVRIGTALRGGNVAVHYQDYLSLEITPGSVIYCDPPYASTQGYVQGEFDSAEFWRWADSISEHSQVFVSEYQAPTGWESIWTATKRQSITMPAQGREVRHEHLFSKEISSKT